MTEEQTTTIDLIRHGEAEGGRLFRGTTDSPLSALGKQQLETVFQRLPQSTLQQIIHSPLQRCASSAQQWASTLNIPALSQNEFREIDFGRWEGKAIDDIYRDEPKLLENFWANPEQHTPHDGERLIDFQQRIGKAWLQLITSIKGQHCCLLSHGGVMRIILAQLLNIPLAKISHIDVPHACWSRISIYHSKDKADWPQLVFHNK